MYLFDLLPQMSDLRLVYRSMLVLLTPGALLMWVVMRCGGMEVPMKCWRVAVSSV